MGESLEASRNGRCVLLFSRTAREESRSKGLSRAEPVFRLARRRLIEALSSLPEVDLVVAGPAGAEISRTGVLTIRQRGRGFGRRLRNAFEDAMTLGYREVVAVAGDVPGLDAGPIEAAFRSLSSHTVVLGPSPDGGVYLIGLIGAAGRLDRLFDRIPWRSRAVFRRLVSNAGGERNDPGASLPRPALGTSQDGPAPHRPGAAVLQPLHDVDGHRALRALAWEGATDDEVLSLLVRNLLLPLALRRDRHRPPRAASLALAALPSRAPPSSPHPA